MWIPLSDLCDYLQGYLSKWTAKKGEYGIDVWSERVKRDFFQTLKWNLPLRFDEADIVKGGKFKAWIGRVKGALNSDTSQIFWAFWLVRAPADITNLAERMF